LATVCPPPTVERDRRAWLNDRGLFAISTSKPPYFRFGARQGGRYYCSVITNRKSQAAGALWIATKIN